MATDITLDSNGVTGTVWVTLTYRTRGGRVEAYCGGDENADFASLTINAKSVSAAGQFEKIEGEWQEQGKPNVPTWNDPATPATPAELASIRDAILEALPDIAAPPIVNARHAGERQKEMKGRRVATRLQNAADAAKALL